MPLLGKVVFNEPVRKIGSESSENSFVIPHTNEVFASKEEYEERLQLYNRKVWTCQCTGHINLTHKEAVESEQNCREMLAHSFPEIYEHPVLSCAHHSSDVLDKIVNKAYKLVRSQLFIGERVHFGGSPGKKFEAKILKIHLEKAENHEGVNGSPSSDKENSSSKQSLITDLFKTATSPERSEKSSESSVANSPEKAEPPNHKYDILLVTENKIIRGVPGVTLTGTNRPPTRHCIRLFVRSNAIRHDYKKSKAWIVDQEMVEKHGLVSKLSKDEESNFLKATSIASNSFVGYTHHAPPLANGTSAHNGDPIHDDSTNENEDKIPVISIEKLAAAEDNASSKPIKLAPIFSPKTKSKKVKLETTESLMSGVVSSIDYDSLAMSEVLVKQEKPKKIRNNNVGGDRKRKMKNQDAGPRKKQKKVAQKPVINGKVSDDEDDTPLSKLSGSNNSSAAKSPGSSRKSTSPKKKKQATLLELTRKKGGMMLMKSTKSHALGSLPGSPAKKARAPRQPPIVYQLLRLKKEKKFQAHKYKVLLNDAARMLNEKQRKNLPDLVKQDILTKWELIERKRKWDSMTPEERKQVRAQERIKKNKRFEDTDIVASGKAKPLPAYEPAYVSGGLPNAVFGDIAMVAEFIHSYRTLLSPREPKIITHIALAEALSVGKKGYESISRIMILMFHMLLSDGIAQEYKELDFKIDQVPVTAEVCSELARICLRQLDDDLEEDLPDKSDDQIDEDSTKTVATGINEEVFSKLLDNEIYELDPYDQLEVLCAIAYRLTNTYTAQQFREETRDRASEAWKRMNKLRVEDNLLKKEKKVKKQKEKEQRTGTKPVVQVKKGKSRPQKNEAIDGADLISRVKRRRIEAAEKQQQEEEERIRWEEEKNRLFIEQTKKAEHDKTVRQFHESDMLAARAVRLNALGTDRDHNRYWLFSDCTPGLYVEKGWVQDYISYTTQSDLKQTPKKDLVQTSEDELPLSLLSSPNGIDHKVSSKETTVPHVGQNLWFVVDSKEKFDEILANLCTKGIRESHLKKMMEKKYNHIVRSIAKYQASLPTQTDQTESAEKVPIHATRRSTSVKDPDEDVRKSLRKRLQSIVHDVSRGGLANIQDDHEVFVARVESAEDVSDFSTLMVDIFNAVDMRFFREYMTGIAQKKNQKRSDLLPYEEQEKLINPKKIAKAERRRERWIRAVQTASHYSRLSFLLTVLHSSVMWEMFKYCRTMPVRASARVKNYAEMVQDPPEEEEEGEKEKDNGGEEEPEEDVRSVRRSTRLITRGGYPGLRTRRGRRPNFEEESEGESEESSDAEDDDSQDDDESQEEDESQEDDDSQGEEDEEGEDLERCLSVINRLLQYKCSSVFRYAVEEEDVPDYYEVIENPMSLSDVKDRIEKASGLTEQITSPGSSRTRSAAKPPAAPPAYSPDQLLEDVRLVLDNAEMYNGQDSFVWRQALKLKAAFVRCFLDNFRHSVRLTKRLNRLFDNTEND